jgi:methylglyoxal synthase
MNIALIAQKKKKKLMENLCIAYRHILSKHSLFATETTGRQIQETTGLQVHTFLAGYLGGVEQLGSQIAYNKIDLVIFLRDPMTQKPYNSDDNPIFRLSDAHNIPIASNLATAEALILALDRGDLDWRNIINDGIN